VIIGLSGYARSGKDTAAAGMDMWGFKRVAFADKLRDFLYLLNPVVKPRYDRAFAPLVPENWRVQHVIDRYGWGMATRKQPTVPRFVNCYSVSEPSAAGS
jgi:hypothetical protein